MKELLMKAMLVVIILSINTAAQVVTAELDYQGYLFSSEHMCRVKMNANPIIEKMSINLNGEDVAITVWETHEMTKNIMIVSEYPEAKKSFPRDEFIEITLRSVKEDIRLQLNEIEKESKTEGRILFEETKREKISNNGFDGARIFAHAYMEEGDEKLIMMGYCFDIYPVENKIYYLEIDNLMDDIENSQLNEYNSTFEFLTKDQVNTRAKLLEKRNQMKTDRDQRRRR